MYSNISLGCFKKCVSERHRDVFQLVPRVSLKTCVSERDGDAFQDVPKSALRTCIRYSIVQWEQENCLKNSGLFVFINDNKAS